MSKKEPKTITFDCGKTYQLDDQGFLNPPDQWDERFAKCMAREQGIWEELTDQHWQIINYLRKKFTKEHVVPVVVMACADNNLRLSDLRFLFPTGYHRGACRIAGINYDFMYESNYWLTYETSTMPRVDHTVTPRGYISDFNKWNERFAELIIREWKLPQGLTDRHREIINFMRDFYTKNKSIPNVFEACKSTNLDFKELIELFPDGYHRGVCRISGLPFF